MKQPTIDGKNVYHEGGYYHKARWATFYYQYQHIFNSGARKVLEIGPGGGVLTQTLRDHGVEVVTLDIDPGIRPDVVGDALDLPFEDGSFDAVVAFEVLEHVPFMFFKAALEEMGRVSRKDVFVSLPDHARSLLRLDLKLPWLRERHWSLRVPAFDNERFWAPCGHCWEVGNLKYPLRKVKESISRAGLELRHTAVHNDAPMTRFFLMSK